MPVPPVIPKIELSKPPDPYIDPAGYLRSINSVRGRCALVLEKAKRNDLEHFTVDMEQFAETTRFVVSIIKVSSRLLVSLRVHNQVTNWCICNVKRDFAPDYASIPPHGRWQHFNVGGRDRITPLLASWGKTADQPELCRRLLDLFLVSVLLDAGAGNTWSYTSREDGRRYRRSEGLAIASLEMFKSGMFSSHTGEPCQVDADGLRRLNVQSLAKGLQVTPDNPIAGLRGRTGLLIRLADALNNTELFGADARPGNMLGMFLSLFHKSYA